MDVVVVDVPPKFGLLLSRSWEDRLKGTFQMDLSYTMILVFGEQRIFYRENHLVYMINNKDNPDNHPIYTIDTDMGSSMLFNHLCAQKTGLVSGESAKNEANQRSTEAKQMHGHSDLSPT